MAANGQRRRIKLGRWYRDREVKPCRVCVCVCIYDQYAHPNAKNSTLDAALAGGTSDQTSSSTYRWWERHLQDIVYCVQYIIDPHGHAGNGDRRE